MFDDHVDKFKLSNKGTVLLFEFFPFLGHELLDIVILFIGDFKFVIDLG